MKKGIDRKALAPLSGVCCAIGTGLDVLTEAFAMAAQSGERYCEAELYRLKGELLLQRARPQLPPTTDHDAAQACFHQAIAIARQQCAKSLELRAAASLARIWQQRGKTDAARLALAGIHGAFTEGFDTADWQQAKALLDSLA